MKTTIGRIVSIAAWSTAFLMFLTFVSTAMAQTSDGRPPASPPPPGCTCPPGSYYYAERKSCIKEVCDNVKGIPNGDKGGGFFAYNGAIWENVACVAPPCKDLNLTAFTGGPGWRVSWPGLPGGKVPVNVSPYPNWAGPIPPSSWVSIDATRGDPPGTSGVDYTYTYQFCLCKTVDVTKATLSLQLYADNGADVYLNRTISPSPILTVPVPYGFQLPVKQGPPFASPPKFVAGTNTLTIVVHNQGGPTGLDAVVHIIAPNGAGGAGPCPRVIGPVRDNLPPNPN
jgi:hypothetical protein